MHKKCWRLLTLRICFREKHRQILLGNFRKGLDITFCLKEEGKHSYCTWTVWNTASVSWLWWAKANGEKSKASQMSHFSKQFTRNYFYQSRQRNTSVLRAKLKNREDWWCWDIRPSRVIPAKHSCSQSSTSSIRCATSTGKCHPCPGEKRQQLPHAKHESTPSPATSASTTQIHRELAYRFVLQLLQEVFSWVPCYFQDLGQLIQVWQAGLKITLWGANPGHPHPSSARDSSISSWYKPTTVT